MAARGNSRRTMDINIGSIMNPRQHKLREAALAALAELARREPKENIQAITRYLGELERNDTEDAGSTADDN